MRRLLLLALLGSTAAPAFAQDHSRPLPPPPPGAVSLPPEITDGRVLDQMGDMVGALTRAVLNLPIGEVEAAVENRPATRADRAKTVRSVSGMDDREIDAGIEESKVAVKSGGQAISRALPVIVESLNRAGEEIARATANLPQPGYPRR